MALWPTPMYEHHHRQELLRLQVRSVHIYNKPIFLACWFVPLEDVPLNKFNRFCAFLYTFPWFSRLWPEEPELSCWWLGIWYSIKT